MDNLEFSQKLEARFLDFDKKVGDFCRKLPRDDQNREYADQLNRSSCSIGANYIEANESLSRKDFFHRIRICRKESKECKYWLEIIGYANPLLRTEVENLEKEALEFLRLFSSILKKAT